MSTLDENARAWRARVAAATARAWNAPPDWPAGTRLDLLFVFPTRFRERHGQLHPHRPDADNLSKLVMDVLEEQGFFPAGDASVADLRVRKVWGPQGAEGAVIRVRDAEPVPGGYASLFARMAA